MQRRGFLAGLALATAGCARADPGDAPPVHAVNGSGNLDAFFAALRSLQRGARKTPVSIVQIGDSHTANDGFSGRMRELMQQRFGNAGRGMLPPGIPFRLYRADGVHVTAENFQIVPSFPHAGLGPFGISGLRQHAVPPATMVLKAERPGDLADLTIEFLGQPGGGVVQLTCDDGPHIAFPTDSADGRPLFAHLSAPSATQITLQVPRGNVDMLSWRARRAEPGITWSNLGTIGATVALLERWDPAFVRAELAFEDPSLIVLAFGSNEGFDDTTNLAVYAQRYRAAIALLQNAAPNASMLLIGPPDGVRHPVDGAGTLCPGTMWQSPPNLARVRRVQSEVAADLGLTFWDWSGPMGGACTMPDWAAQTPPLAAADHLHLLHAGYRRTADSLFSELMHGYDQAAAKN